MTKDKDVNTSSFSFLILPVVLICLLVGQIVFCHYTMLMHYPTKNVMLLEEDASNSSCARWTTTCSLFDVSVEYIQNALAINYSETTTQRRRPLYFYGQSTLILVILLSTDNVSQHTSALKVCFRDQHGECMLLIQNEVLVVLSLSGVPLS